MSWSDYADWEALEFCPLIRTPLETGYGCLEGLIRAVNERCDAAQSVSSYAYTPYTINRVAKICVDGYGNLTLGWDSSLLDACAAIQDKITQLLPYFCQHGDNGGDWSGLGDGSLAAPAWTWAKMLEAIGAATRITAPDKWDGLSAEWLHQQYLILNQLRWALALESPPTGGVNPSKHKGIPPGSSSAGYLHAYDYGYMDGWPDISIPNALVAGEWPDEWVDDWAQEAYAVLVGQIEIEGLYYAYYAKRAYRTYKLVYDWSRGAVPVDHYSWLSKYYPGEPEHSFALEDGVSGDANTVVKTCAATVTLDGTLVQLGTVGNIGGIPWWPPDNGTNKGWALRSIRGHGALYDCVVKLDGPNGFEFLDTTS